MARAMLLPQRGLSEESLIHCYRRDGHLLANLDPLNIQPSIGKESILEQMAVDEAIERTTDGKIRIGQHVLCEGQREQLEAHLAQIYSGKLVFELAHLEDAVERQWLYRTIEQMHDMQATPAMQKRMAFDHFMTKRFGQVKRYGLEGAETMLVAIDTIMQVTSAQHLVLAMPHRGRLNLLIGLLGYPKEALFHKLSGKSELESGSDGSADVLSHLAHKGPVKLGSREGIATLLPNPSHLEVLIVKAIDPVQQGYAYALRGEGQDVLAVQMHGDAAFCGQGIVQETLQMSQLAGFNVGGMIHLVVNNQLGYTAPPSISRTSRYATSPAKMTNAPIIHVNGDSPQDVARAASIAIQYRHRFGKDVIIDLVCYRRHGHNELDEPAFTQPSMYRTIKAKVTTPQAYAQDLIEHGVMETSDPQRIIGEETRKLEEAVKVASVYIPKRSAIQNPAKATPTDQGNLSISTGVPKETLLAAAEQSISTPDSFNLHPRLQKYHVEARKTMLKNGHVDWATAEAMAIGSLLEAGFNVRLSGQDVQRGTFSQRHLLVHDAQTDEQLIPLNRWDRAKGKFEIINSHLSELAVLGFEYGASIVDPARTLAIWEAQFGDFFNGAQIIFDTFLSSGQAKWDLQSGLVVLLPHGYDGTGPEHSSCRIERFLQMCNAPLDPRINFDCNWQVVHPTTPANYFHLLRRQVVNGGPRKPLIVASPKILLRLPAAVSPLEDLLPSGRVQPVLDDEGGKRNTHIRQLVFCSGKFYYELDRERTMRKVRDMAIIRIEELCPLPGQQLATIIAKYSKASRYVWCQEEHQNMGPYSFLAPRLTHLMPPSARLEYVGRPPAAAPAAGYSELHKAELNNIMASLFVSSS